MAPGPDNPAGYWENRTSRSSTTSCSPTSAVRGTSRRCSRRAGSSIPASIPFRERAREILLPRLRRAAAGRPDGVQGAPPLPAAPVLATVVPISHTVVVVRHPSEVVESLRSRNGIDPGQGAVLWLRYLSPRGRRSALCCVRLDDLDRPARTPTAAVWPSTSGSPQPAPRCLDEVPRPPRSRAAPPAAAGTRLRPRTTPASPNPAWPRAGGVERRRRRPRRRARVGADRARAGLARPPADREALDAARAEAVELREKLRKWHRRRKGRRRDRTRRSRRYRRSTSERRVVSVSSRTCAARWRSTPGWTLLPVARDRLARRWPAPATSRRDRGGDRPAPPGPERPEPRGRHWPCGPPTRRPGDGRAGRRGPGPPGAPAGGRRT